MTDETTRTPPVDVADGGSRLSTEPATSGPTAETADEAPVAIAPADVDVDRAIEALLMVADEPQSVVGLATALGRPVVEVHEAIGRLVRDFDGVDGTVRRGFELREVGGGWRFYVRADQDALVAAYVNQQNPSRLSQAALETLAVIAYKQPISRSAIASIRAVNVDSVVRTLLGRGLITELFTDSETGAINYGTTDVLLDQLGINSLDELPLISPLLADGQEGFDVDVR